MASLPQERVDDLSKCRVSASFSRMSTVSVLKYILLVAKWSMKVDAH